MSESPAPPDQPQQIRAYYKLEFPGAGNGQGRDYYFQTLSITIGRRPLPPAPRSPSTSAEPAHGPAVDVHLGALKSVSRLHAKIEYDETVGAFVFVVHGRNGAWVDDVWIAKGGKVTLRPRTKLQIANRTFFFQLPPGSGEQGDFPHSHPDSTPVDVTTVTPPAGDSPSPSPPRSSASPMRDVKEEETEGSALRPPASGSGPPNVQKPQLTYAQLCYRALREMNGRATLQDIIDWTMRSFEFYRLDPNTGWQRNIRHTLSMNNAFVKSPKSQGERGKGCNWTLHPNAYQLFEAPQPNTNRHHPYQPPDGVRRAAQAVHPAATPPTAYPPTSAYSAQAPPAAPSASYPSAAVANTPAAATSGPFNLPSNVSLPIVIAPMPANGDQSSATPHLDAPPIVLEGGMLVLNPTIFAHLSQEQLNELQQLGAQQALKILQAYIVEYLKERMRGEKSSTGKPKGKKKKVKKEGKADGAGADTPNIDPEASKATISAQAGSAAAQTVANLLAHPPPASVSPGPGPAEVVPHTGGSGEVLAALAEAAIAHTGEQ